MFDSSLAKLVVRNVYTSGKMGKLTKIMSEMARRKISCAVVVEKRKPIGILSERDIVRLVSEKKIKNSTLVQDVMSSPVSTLREAISVENAIKLMRKEGFRRFPVVNDQDELIGLVTQSDIVKAAEESMRDYARELENRMEKASKKTAHLIMTDDLTGLYNRRYLKERLSEEFDRCKRYSLPISCMMVDIDRFKAVNDQFGHPAGDIVLKRLAKLLVRNLRRGDVCARIGGEEFFMLLPHTMLAGAVVVADRLRASVEDTVFKLRRKQARITLSIGLCNLPAHEPADANDFLRMADDALYAAKRKGRNRVDIYAPPKNVKAKKKRPAARSRKNPGDKANG